ncbi:MAG: hypothetical protein KGS72_02365 [Cyanobacteria bacterium REEB67]|nr:hypothetical protein [Cyanobacteria bacterium REEB67]
MSVFSDASSDETMMRDGRGPGPVPVGLENARQQAFFDNRAGLNPSGNVGDSTYQSAANYTDNGYRNASDYGDRTQVADNSGRIGYNGNDGGISTRVAERFNPGRPVIGRDGQQEPQNPIHLVNNYDRAGNLVGSSEYNYSANEGTGVKLNGYVDRDAQGNIKEFAVRKPALYADQKDVYMVFRATPGHPIDEGQMQHINQLLRPDVSPEQRRANQVQLNNERPLADNLQHNMGKQIVALRLDPQTGQRFEVRDMRIDPNTGRQITSESNPTLCWKGPHGEYFRTPVASLPDFDKQDLANATWHGNMRQPLRFLNEAAQGQRPQPTQREMIDRYRDQPGRGPYQGDPRYQDGQDPNQYQDRNPNNYQDQNPPVLRRRM